jgi:hypothetical protein
MHKKIDQSNLNIFYGYLCNYSCEGCFSGSNSVDTIELDPDLQKTFDSIEPLSNLFNVQSMVTLIGGEPFLYWDSRIVPLALEINHCFPNIKINITTNGQLLGKNVDKIYSLSEKIDNLSLTISRHLRAVTDVKIKEIWDQNMHAFLNDPKIIQINEDHYHIKDNVNANIYFTNIDNWKSYYYYHGTDIKPWATDDPEKSMAYGCPGNVCSCVFEDKIYKCANLATLSGHLASRGQENDPDWNKYLSYPAIDVHNIDLELLNNFEKTYGKPTTYCDMCSNSQTNILNWEQRTFPMVFSKTKQINY